MDAGMPLAAAHDVTPLELARTVPLFPTAKHTVVDGQLTALSSWLLTAVFCVHVLPLELSSVPESPTATQTVLDGHDMPRNALPTPEALWAVQTVPLDCV